MLQGLMRRLYGHSWLWPLTCAALPALAAAILILPGLLSGRMLWGADFQSLGLPFLTSARRSMSQGAWPLWMPELLQGMPGIASGGMDCMHPCLLALNLLGVPPWSIMALVALPHICLACWGAHLFARSQGVSLTGGLLAGLFYGLSGSYISIFYLGHTSNIFAVAMIPWALLAADSGVRRQSESRAWLCVPALSAWALAGVALALQILGLGIQMFSYTLLTLLAFILWRSWTLDREALCPRPARTGGLLTGCLLMGLTAACVSAPQLLTTWQYIPYTWRDTLSHRHFIGWSFPPWEAIQYIVPGFHGWVDPLYRGDMGSQNASIYLGLIPLALAGAAVACRAGQKRGPVLFFALAAALSFTVALGGYTPLHQLFFHLPIYRGYRAWNRFLHLTNLSLCVMAGFGYDALIGEEEGPRARLAALLFSAGAALAALACVAACHGAAQDCNPDLLKHFSDPAMAREALEKVMRDSSLRALATAAACAALFGASLRWRARIGTALLLPLLLALHFADMRQIYGRFIVFKDPAGMTAAGDYARAMPDPTRGEPYRVFEMDNVWAHNEQVYGGFENVKGYHGVGMQPNYRLEKAMDAGGRMRDFLNLMGARYFIAYRPFSMPGLTFTAGSPGQVYVFENRQAFRRAFLVHQGIPVSADEEAWSALASPSVDPAKTAFVSGGRPISGPDPGGESVDWLSRGAGRFSLRVVARAPAYLVVAQSWFPGWKALVDGAEAGVLKADGAIQAVYLDFGEHRVDFAFTSPLFEFGLALSLLGLAATALLAGLAREGQDDGPHPQDGAE